MKVSKALYVINYILVAFCFCICSFLANGERMFGEYPTAHLSLLESTISFVVLFVTVAATIFINARFGKYKPNFILISLLVFVFVIGLISLLTFKNYGTYSFSGVDGSPCIFEYDISSSLRASYILGFAASLISVYLLFDTMYQLFKLDDLFKLISFISITLALIFIIISYSTEFTNYINFFPSLFKGEYVQAAKSVFMSKNNYAFILSLSFIGCIILHFYYKKWYLVLGMGLIYLNIFFTLCKLMLLFDLLLALLYFGYFFFKNYNLNPARNRNILIITCSIIAVVFVGIIIALSITNRFDSLFSQDGYNTFQTRVWIWQRSVETINLGNWFIGVGHNLFNDLLIRFNTFDVVTQSPNNTRFAHNAFLEWIGSGGILMLLVGILIYSMLIYMLVKNFKKNRDLTIISIGLIAVFTINMFFESASFIFPKAFDTIALSIFVVVPIVSIYKGGPQECYEIK